MFIKPNLILIFFVEYVCGLFLSFTPIIELSQGKLRGFRTNNSQNRYYGIPYAVSERFQAPKPPPKRNGIFHALYQFDSCAQAIGILHLGTEDCLNLDIYTPGNATEDQKLPVLTFFHGGGYYYGSKWQYNPAFLVKKNVIVVIANYRVGVLGFLCLNNVANLGLKDQLAALKWIQKNIAAFGGDPDNVTISGQSAGASGASMHLLSRQSKGLFHKAILMSGIALAPWAFNIYPMTAAFEDASKIGKVYNESDVYNTFLKAPVNDLLSATYGTSIDMRSFKYSPCEDSNYTNSFFHDSPYNVIKSGDFNKVPMIIGFTDLEGLLFYGLNSQRDLKYLEDNLDKRLPSVFSWCSDKDKRKLASKIRSNYFGKQKINSKASAKGVIDLYSDWVAYASIDASSKLIAKHSDKPVYNYIFSYEAGRNVAKFIFNNGLELKGATHTDDLLYVYNPGVITLPLSNSENILIEKFTTMLTNFMKYGDPTPTQTTLLPLRWPPTTANRSQVMRIDQPLSVIDTPVHVKGEFFLKLLCKYGLSGFVPCDSAMQCNLKI